ncbi:MAG: hypothetical protein JJT89_07485 [Nitriliruptoraceae bacterium]|nr:hypothetical protein [Nitriliruptoraceae bacterium]
MSDRARAVVVGLVLGFAALLLLDLTAILAETVASGQTSPWWPIAGYVGVGLLAAVGVGYGGRDRLVPAIAATVVLLVALPAVPAQAPAWVPALPLVPSTPATQAVAFVLVGAFTFGAVRGGKV